MAERQSGENVWRQVRELFQGVDPQALAQESDRPVSVALVARGPGELRQMDEFFVPSCLRPRQAEETRRKLALFLVPLHPSERQALSRCDLAVCSEGATEEIGNDAPQRFVFRPENPQAVLKEILQQRGDLALPLDKNFLPFRRLVQRRWTQSVALENTLFAMLATIAEEVPAPLALLPATPASGRRFAPSSPALASDSLAKKLEGEISAAFLTANQMRLAFLMAASSDSAVGFQEQRGQITAVAAAALGWRVLTRGVEQRLPSGSRLLTRGLLAFLGTYTVGLALEQFHAWGRSLTREEKSAAYEQTYRLGRRMLDEVLERMAARARSAA
ncbi:MAG: hypothetical protein HYS38_03550 [Acidobacteria bacterium]|nr:hypothetical protein [Acidobacteriota bacterium]